MHLKDSKTVVIKIGSSLLIDDSKIIREKWLSEFAKDIKNLQNSKKNLIIVSSGAIAPELTIIKFFFKFCRFFISFANSDNHFSLIILLLSISKEEPILITTVLESLRCMFN